jgi:thioredoxin 1
MSPSAIIVLAIILIFGFLFVRSYRKLNKLSNLTDHQNIKVLTNQNFHNQIKTGITLVDFWAEWCMPCKMMAPVLNDVAEELNGRASVGKLNVEQHNDIASQFGVSSIPTMIMFKNGREINRFVGVKSKDFLVKEINKVPNK